MNLSLFVSIPGEDEDREGPPKSRYVSKKDIRWLSVAVIVLIILGYPIYVNLRDGRDWHLCAGNMNAVYKAISGYVADHDDRFPPVAEEDNAHTGTPGIYDGRLRTWVTQAFLYDNRSDIYTCPKAEDAETYPNEGDVRREGNTPSRVTTVRSSYGMYRGYGTAMVSSIDRRDQVVLFTETSNFGSETSYDPLPFKDRAGNPVPYDGFSVGWDTNNVEPDPTSKKVTRLAFHDSASGDFSKAYGRHPQGIHAITADGNLLIIRPGDVNIRMRAGEPQGYWAVPAFIGGQ